MASKRKPKALHAEASYESTTATMVKATMIVEKVQEMEEANPKQQHHRQKHQLKSSTNNKKKNDDDINQVMTTTLSDPDEENARRFLSAQGWSEGMQESLIKSCKKMAIRYIITDDSGSMMTNDGHKLIGSNVHKMKLINCTRWSELTHSLKFHAQLAHAAKAPTEFRLLNNCDPIMVGDPLDVEGDGLHVALQVFEEETPSGQTPLCYHIGEVVKCIQLQEDELRTTGRRACLVIATDGESTDGDLADAMKPLEDLPVWVVIRLCTDEDSVVEYWNNIDSQLELDMDVLDDLNGEAHEVHSANPWVTYADPLQKLREFGASLKEMDLLDESLLSSEQMRVLCSMLISNGDPRSLPHPDEDWKNFFNALKQKNTAQGLVWDPLTKTAKEWIDLKQLTLTYGEVSASSSCAVS